jgi:DNA replication protein DnaC
MKNLKINCNECNREMSVEVSDMTYDNEIACSYLKSQTTCDYCKDNAARNKKEFELAHLVIPERIEKSRLPVDFYADGFDANRLPDPDLYSFAYVNRHQNIVLSDVTGIGKTGTLIEIGKEQCKFKEVLFFLLPSLVRELATLRQNFNRQVQYEQLWNRVLNVPLLIIDDVGKEEQKHASLVYEIFDYRYTHYKTTYSTLNMGNKEMMEQYGKDKEKPMMRRMTGKHGVIWDNRVRKMRKSEKEAS